MPRLLKKLITWPLRHKRAAVCGLALLALAVLALAAGLWPLALAALVALAALLCNKLVVHRLNAQMAPWGDRSGVRNVDCLVIGELCDSAALAREYCAGGGVLAPCRPDRAR